MITQEKGVVLDSDRPKLLLREFYQKDSLLDVLLTQRIACQYRGQRGKDGTNFSRSSSVDQCFVGFLFTSLCAKGLHLT